MENKGLINSVLYNKNRKNAYRTLNAVDTHRNVNDLLRNGSFKHNEYRNYNYGGGLHTFIKRLTDIRSTIGPRYFSVETAKYF